MKIFYTRVEKIIFKSKMQSTLFSKRLVQLVHLWIQVIGKYIKLGRKKKRKQLDEKIVIRIIHLFFSQVFRELGQCLESQTKQRIILRQIHRNDGTDRSAPIEIQTNH